MAYLQASLLLWWLSLLCPEAAQAQAPGDHDDSCRTGITTRLDHIFPREWTLLLDTYDYFTLYGGTGAVWLARSFDATPTSSFIVDGGICERPISTCTFADTPPHNNWVFSQYISYNRALQVFVNLTYNFARCFDEDCVPYYTLYRYDTDGEVSDAMRTDRGNYRPLFGTETNSRVERPRQINNNVMETRDFTRPSNSEGFYLAVRDTGTCGSINRIIIYYMVFPGRTDPLTNCPDVPLPVQSGDSSSSLSCTCIGNSSGLQEGSLVRSCDPSGACTDGGSCECDAGFRFNYDSNMCEACPEETFKAEVSNNGTCDPCPMRSEARDPGSAICACIPPNSRADDDGPEVECRDMSFSTSAAVAITFFVTLIVVGVAAFLAGGAAMYFWMGWRNK